MDLMLSSFMDLKQDITPFTLALQYQHSVFLHVGNQQYNLLNDVTILLLVRSLLFLIFIIFRVGFLASNDTMQLHSLITFNKCINPWTEWLKHTLAMHQKFITALMLEKSKPCWVSPAIPTQNHARNMPIFPVHVFFNQHMVVSADGIITLTSQKR